MVEISTFMCMLTCCVRPEDFEQTTYGSQSSSFLPSSIARTGQYYLLKLLRKKLKGDRRAQWRIGRLYKVCPTGFIVNVMSKYKNGKQAAAYCCRYTGRPPLSEKRIVSYDGQTVTLAYRDYRDGQDKTL